VGQFDVLVLLPALFRRLAVGCVGRLLHVMGDRAVQCGQDECTVPRCLRVVACTAAAAPAFVNFRYHLPLSAACSFDDVFDETVSNDQVYSQAIQPLISTIFK